jgi:hypothetical protein
MNFTVHFSTRDFSAPLLTTFKAVPIRLDWSVYGGPDSAQLKLTDDGMRLTRAASLLRSPVMINDLAGRPVWWGYVEEVIIYLDQVQISVSLGSLFNRVSVRYSYISPDYHLDDQHVTSFADDAPSQKIFGIKEIVLQRLGIDDDFAENLRDTFLNQSAWPTSILSQSFSKGRNYAFINCAGWFKTLSWQSYQNLEGFYANTGPGPGIFTFGQSSSYRYPSQSFTPGAPGAFKYAYFQLRGVGDPTRNLNAQIRTQSGTLLATSDPIPGSSLSSITYRWVKFSFSTPYDLLGGTTYLVGVTGNGTNASKYFAIRTDENQSYENGGGLYFNGAAWVNLPSITHPGGAPDLLFRAVCITDTGTQIDDIANASSQFFNRITVPPTDVLISPYRTGAFDGLREIEHLMALGTSSQRRILARVTPERHLEFYEQPQPDDASIYMDDQGRFYTFQGTLLKAYFPPVGHYARYAGSGHFIMPFDRANTPACFIEKASFWTKMNRVRIN